MDDTELIDLLLGEIQSRLVPDAPRVTRETLPGVVRDVMQQARLTAEKSAELQDRMRKASAALMGC